jgi:hypothetical protein
MVERSVAMLKPFPNVDIRYLPVFGVKDTTVANKAMPSEADLKTWKEIFEDKSVDWTVHPAGEVKDMVFGEKDTGHEDMEGHLDRCLKDLDNQSSGTPINKEPETTDDNTKWSSLALMGLAGLAGSFVSTVFDKPSGVRVAGVMDDIIPEEVASVLEQRVS